MIPVYNTNPVMLKELAESLVAQTYPNWEAILYDGASTKPETRAALQEVAAMDERLKVVYGAENGGISGNSNEGLKHCSGEYVALCDHDDLLTADALYRVAEILSTQAVDILYSDEDKIDENNTYHHSAHFKPDFCLDNLRAGNYICHLMVIRRSLMEAVGGFRSAFDGSQDHDLVLRCCEQAKHIVHIPRILYHWRTVGSSASHQHLDRCIEASRKAVEEHIARMGTPGKVRVERGSLRIAYDVDDQMSVNIIITDNADPNTWDGFVKAMKALRKAYRVTFTVISPLQSSATDLEARWVAWQPDETVYAAMNRAADLAEENMLCFLHAATFMHGIQWLKELLMLAQREDVGAVTPVLTTMMGRIVHAGYTVGMEKGALCRHRKLPTKAGGWHGIMHTVHNVAALSAACFVVRKDHLLPFEEAYIGPLGMVDWCLRMGKAGYAHVFTPHAVGNLNDSAAQELLLADCCHKVEDEVLFNRLWPRPVQDPCYSEHFCRERADFSLPKPHGKDAFHA